MSAPGWARPACRRSRCSLLSRRLLVFPVDGLLDQLGAGQRRRAVGGVGEVLEVLGHPGQAHHLEPGEGFDVDHARPPVVVGAAHEPGVAQRWRRRGVGGCPAGPQLLDQRVGRRGGGCQRPTAGVLEPGHAAGLLGQRHHPQTRPVGLLDDLAGRRGSPGSRPPCSGRWSRPTARTVPGSSPPAGCDARRACARAGWSTGRTRP